MQVRRYETEEEWLADRPGHITGTGLNKIVTHKGSLVKTGVYQLIADKLVLADGTVDGRDRGHELEQEAIDKLGEELGLEFITDLEMWVSDKDPTMAFSPDGHTKDYTICAEAKCLGSALHVEAVITEKIPATYKLEFHLQKVQAFIVNEKLQEHYTAFYDPRITAFPLFYIKTTRAELEDDINYYLEYQEKTIKFVNEWVEKLTF